MEYGSVRGRFLSAVIVETTAPVFPFLKLFFTGQADSGIYYPITLHDALLKNIRVGFAPIRPCQRGALSLLALK